jgi:hypothetical protein
MSVAYERPWQGSTGCRPLAGRDPVTELVATGVLVAATVALITFREATLSVSQVTRTWSRPSARATGSASPSMAVAYLRRLAVGRTS